MCIPSNSTMLSPDTIAQDLITLLEERGNDDYIGESVSQLEHCLQCAHYGIKFGSLVDLQPSFISHFQSVSFMPTQILILE